MCLEIKQRTSFIIVREFMIGSMYFLYVVSVVFELQNAVEKMTSNKKTTCMICETLKKRVIYRYKRNKK